MTAFNYSLGYMRDDGDFQLLATLNNNDGDIGTHNFQTLAEHLRDMLEARTGEAIMLLERQDAPDYVDIS